MHTQNISTYQGAYSKICCTDSVTEEGKPFFNFNDKKKEKKIQLLVLTKDLFSQRTFGFS